MHFDFGFRVDVGNDIGSGHFFRCLSIAEKLIEKNFKVIFLVNNLQETESHLSGKNFPYQILGSSSEQRKIDECKILSKNISKLIIDLPFDNQIYSESLKDVCKIITLDDLGNKKIISDILINGSIVPDFQNYIIDINTTKSFLGKKFTILRSEFKTARDHVLLNKKLQKILLIFGGSDDSDLTLQLTPYFFDKSYNLTIVLGPSYNNLEKLKKLIPNNQNFQIIRNEKNLASLFSNQDLVISSSGITSYELACLGIPSIFIPVDKYQIKTAIEMEKNGFGINYGYWDDDFSNLENYILQLSDYSIREKMYYSGRKLIDGEGLERILKSIIEL